MNAIAYPVHPAWRTAQPLLASRGEWKPGAVKVGPLTVTPELGQTAGSLKATAAGVMLVPTAMSAAIAYVGFRLGSTDHGFPSILGYAVGALGAIGAFFGLLAVLGIASIPTQRLDELLKEQQAPQQQPQPVKPPLM